MRKLGAAFLLMWAATNPGCSCDKNGTHMGPGDGGDDLSVAGDLAGPFVPPDMAVNPDAIAGGALVVTPTDVTLDITQGMPAPTQAYTATTQSGMDVTSMALWTVDDGSLGGFNGSTFTAATTHGGTTHVHAIWMGLTGYAQVHVKLHANVATDSCPGCPAFPPDTTPACTVSTTTPTILYPPNGTLVPPNMNVMATQFDPGMGNALYEIDYENAVTDVRVETMCNVITDSKMNVTPGCNYDLSQQVWDFLATSNRGGDPLNIIVRATDGSGSCIATSSSMIAISFAQEDLNGGIYYWQSIGVSGTQGATGGIFRYDFGVRGQTPTEFLGGKNAQNQSRCIGCHFLSRDGVKMTYGDDDPDADDEYSDLNNFLLDVPTKAVKPVLMKVGGFQAFSPDHKIVLFTDGDGQMNPNNFMLYDGTNPSSPPTLVPTGGKRATQPDFSPDGAHVVYVQPDKFFLSNGKPDDIHFTGGSLMTMDYSGGTFSTPTPLLTSTGENNFYPAFSPDGKFIIFDQVSLTGTRDGGTACLNPGTFGNCANDSFSNPAARIMFMPFAGGPVVDLQAINTTGNITNSWPRFAPNAQLYKNHVIAWVTFSSTRDYGDVVRNSIQVNGMPQHICYPPEGPENPNGSKNVISDPSCLQPQLWMAAIDLTAAASGVDSSFPAFYLPFQDSKQHNHIAQWVTTLVGPPVPDAGVDMAPDAMPPSCIPGFGACTATDYCCNGICCPDNTCGCIP